jgi:hypothetical protein
MVLGPFEILANLVLDTLPEANIFQTTTLPELKARLCEHVPN